MISTAIFLIFCFLSMLVGMVLGIGLSYFVVKWAGGYQENDDWLNEEWAKDYEDIRDGR